MKEVVVLREIVHLFNYLIDSPYPPVKRVEERTDFGLIGHNY
jgi:hypothetical protein